MPTQKQIDANRANAKLSTGPKTAAGKEVSAANAMTHGLTADKYLTETESVEDFEAAYVARRKLYPPNDPIIDGLVRKITFAHLRIERAFEAELEMLDNSYGSLADVLVRHDKPMKHLNGYESSNRRTLKLLEEELDRYLAMLNKARETGETDGKPEPTPPKPKGPSSKPNKAAKPDATRKTPVSTPAPSASPNEKANPMSASDDQTRANAGASTDAPRSAPPPAAATLPVAAPRPPMSLIRENPETDPISSGSPPPTPKPAIGENSKTNPISSGSPPPTPKPATGENSKTNAISSGSAPPARKPATSENSKTNPISSGSPPTPKLATGENPKTNPISSGSPSPTPKPVTSENSKTNPISSGSALPTPKPVAGENLKTNSISAAGCEGVCNPATNIKQPVMPSPAAAPVSPTPMPPALPPPNPTPPRWPHNYDLKWNSATRPVNRGR